MPVLAPLASHVAAHGKPDEDDLTDLLVPAKLDQSPWAVAESQVWAAFLVRYRGQAGKQDKLMRALQGRGVSEASARLAADCVAQASAARMPSVIIQSGEAPPIAPITCLSEIVALGEWPAGEGVRATLRVAGGPGTVEAPDGIVVSPRVFGPETTNLELTVAGRAADQVVMGRIILRAGSQVRTVEVFGRWVAAHTPSSERYSSLPEEPTPPIPTRLPDALPPPPPATSLSRLSFVEISPDEDQTEGAPLIVDLSGRGDCQTIQEAINRSPAGGKIRVRPGIYREGLVLEKPVEIVGLGKPGDVILEVAGATVVYSVAETGRVANLSLIQAGGGNWYGVDIAGGALTVEGCDITSRSMACLAVRNGADPIVRKCRIHDGKQSGIVVFENGKGTFERCEIIANEGAGVAVGRGAVPTLRRCVASHNYLVAVWARENGGGVFEENDLRGNQGGVWDLDESSQSQIIDRSNIV